MLDTAGQLGLSAVRVIEYLEEHDSRPSSLYNQDQTSTSTETPEPGRKSPVLVGICLHEHLLPEKEFILIILSPLGPDEVLHIPKQKGYVIKKFYG
ncbi:hypothetical protein PSHT_14916 [Puccinia striiformis]|uniref:Uncharacterized protein n=1 Tax=Puccinia striiformis TaxID=27350 RepID=A0A2S4UI25_9BASI|nr:hypothetical protein PSHT_14916 [Puccinia striiformis]